jgi:2-methylisocitrate lyase-like PEP mutase family enzyme
MHHGRGFILPNAWDAGSARVSEDAGFGAIATTSAGIAFTAGRPDGSMSRDEMLERVASIVDAVGCPVSADLEAGYGATPEEVASIVASARDVGVVGANLEDSDPVSRRLFEPAAAADRLAAARRVAPSGTFVLNARIDTYLTAARADDGADSTFAETIGRAHAYVAAGADCVFVPGVADHATIGRLASEIPVPLNVVVGLGRLHADAAELWGLGVTRISTGGSLARAALAYVERAAVLMRDAGRFDFTSEAIPHAELQQRFAPSRPNPAESRT